MSLIRTANCNGAGLGSSTDQNLNLTLPRINPYGDTLARSAWDRAAAREERRKRAASAHRGARDGERSPAIDGDCRGAGAGAGYEVMRWSPPNRSQTAGLSAYVSPCGSCALLSSSRLRSAGGFSWDIRCLGQARAVT